MKLAFISDIHANLEALEAVLADIDSRGVDAIYCLGDVVGYGANPNECATLVSQHCKGVLLGNHDAVATGLLTTQHFNVHARIAIDWTSEQLAPENRSFLAALPLSKSAEIFTMVHATPYESGMWYYITSLEEAAFNFRFFDTQICLVGHTHIPMIIALDDEEIYVHQEKHIYYGREDGGKKPADPPGTAGGDGADGGGEGGAADDYDDIGRCIIGGEGLRLLINVGSVGQPRDRNPQSSYGILDIDEGRFDLLRVKYDIVKAQNKMKKIKMPDFLVNRLAEGR